VADVVDLNADMGEGWGVYRLGDDEAMLDIVTSANVACGFHAGDPLVMHETLSAARARGVECGAHPSYLDPWGFGRRRLPGERPEDVERIVAYQVGAIRGVAALAGHRITHAKAHGALYNAAHADRALADAVARGVLAVDRGLVFLAMPGSALEAAGRAAGLRVACEVFADRAYGDDGNLAPRGTPGAVVHDPDAAAARVVRMVREGVVETVSGRMLPVRADTICVHGDNPAAVAMARAVRDALAAAGVRLAPLTAVLAARGG
jgi:UPF0271 protein